MIIFFQQDAHLQTSLENRKVESRVLPCDKNLYRSDSNYLIVFIGAISNKNENQKTIFILNKTQTEVASQKEIKITLNCQ